MMDDNANPAAVMRDLSLPFRIVETGGEGRKLRRAFLQTLRQGF
jgi:hypothetical protein